MRFKQLSNNLYGMDPTDPRSYVNIDNSKKVQFAGVGNNSGREEVLAEEEISEKEDNLKYMSKRQRKRRILVQKVYQAIGTQTPEDFKAMLQMNLIRNAKVTTKDINLAQKAFGPDIGSMKGKTTRSKPTPAFRDTIEIPHKLLRINEEIVLLIDGLDVNLLKFLTTISHELYYQTAQYLKQVRAKDYEECMQEVYNVYRQGGFTIVEIHCNSEFRKAMDNFAAKQDPPIKMI